MRSVAHLLPLPSRQHLLCSGQVAGSAGLAGQPLSVAHGRLGRSSEGRVKGAGQQPYCLWSHRPYNPPDCQAHGMLAYIPAAAVLSPVLKLLPYASSPGPGPGKVTNADCPPGAQRPAAALPQRRPGAAAHTVPRPGSPSNDQQSLRPARRPYGSAALAGSRLVQACALPLCYERRRAGCQVPAGAGGWCAGGALCMSWRHTCEP